MKTKHHGLSRKEAFISAKKSPQNWEFESFNPNCTLFDYVEAVSVYPETWQVLVTTYYQSHSLLGLCCFGGEWHYNVCFIQSQSFLVSEYVSYVFVT